MRLLLALAVVATALAGCNALADGPELQSARQALPAAERAAQRWSDDAVLVGASAFELDADGRREMRDELADAREEIDEAYRQDELNKSERDEILRAFRVYDRIAGADSDKPGDGRAAAWFFAYLSPSKDVVLAVAVAGGRVVFEEDGEDAGDDFDLDDVEPVGEWGIDSTAAAEAAGIGDADYRSLCDASNVMSFQQLTVDDGRAVWFVGVQAMGETDGPEDAYVAVDAVDGSLVQDAIDLPDEFADLLLAESGVVDGDFLLTVETTATATFEVEDDRHEAMAAWVSLSPAPLQPVTVTITDPEGTATGFTFTPQPGSVGFTVQQDGLLPAAPAGEYRIDVSTGLAPRQEWVVMWCTDGVPVDEDDVENSACLALWEQQQEDGDGDSPAGGARLGGETLSRVHRWLGAW